MIKPRRLQQGDKVAVVSLSWGGLGDAELVHRYYIAKERLEQSFGLQVVVMPHALSGSDFVAQHPELRAADLMEAFADSSIAGIICAIGGDDTIRTLPFINFETIRCNPKVFMGYSDSTINHLMMYKVGLVSFYGPSILSGFGEYVKMFDYTSAAVRAVLFGDTTGYAISSSPEWSSDYVWWAEENRNIVKTMRPDTHGYEVLQGTGTARGHLLGGCIDVFPMAIGTTIWPTLDKWRGAILFIETSEDTPPPSFVKYILRGLAAQGILAVLSGVIVGKPIEEKLYEEYKPAILQVLAEEHLATLPVFYNVNFGHGQPIGVLPYGIATELDCDNKTITLLESATEYVLSNHSSTTHG